MYRLRKSNRFLQRYDDLNLIETYYYLLFACLDYYLSLSLLATYLVYCGLYIFVSCTKWKMLKIESLLCTLTSLNARVCSNVVMKWISGAKHTTRALSSAYPYYLVRIDLIYVLSLMLKLYVLLQWLLYH